MRTEKQIAASRLNGRKSTGATTSQGKARIVAANFKSGVYAESETLPWEDAESLDGLQAEYYDHHLPSSPDPQPNAAYFFKSCESCRNCGTDPWPQ